MGDTPSPPIDAQLGERIAGYASYFGHHAASSYRNGQPLPLIQNPKWQRPMAAIDDAFKHPWENSPGWNSINQAAFRSQIDNWLKENHVTKLAPLAHGYNGWTAAVFLAQVEGTSLPQVVRIGTEGGSMPHLDPPWNPVLLQPHAVSILAHGGDNGTQRIALSRGSIAPMVEPGQPPGFDRFMNDYILRGTPYMVRENKDWSLLSDGTPLSGDPADSLVFRSDALAHEHARDRWNPAAQQRIMQTIHQNTERLQSELQKIYGPDYRLPESMRFVTEQGGIYTPKQSLLLRDPLHPDRAPDVQHHSDMPSGPRRHQKMMFEDSAPGHTTPAAKPIRHQATMGSD